MLADRRMLVILDNAYSVEQVRCLLPGSGRCLTVVTSRGGIPGLVARHGARRVEVEPLTPDASHQLLRGLLGSGVDTDPAAARQLASQPDPLADDGELMGLGRVGNLKESMGKRFDLNVVGSQKVMNLCRDHKVRRLVVLSSVAGERVRAANVAGPTTAIIGAVVACRHAPS